MGQLSGCPLCHRDSLRPFQMSSSAQERVSSVQGGWVVAAALVLVRREGRKRLASLLQIKRMTWICGLSSWTASFKLLILKQDKQRINDLVEHREPGSSQGKGSREATAASPPPALRPGNRVPLSPHKNILWAQSIPLIQLQE